MSCVNYWNECKDCKTETYDSKKKDICEKCGSDNMASILEWDEADDHHE